MDRAALRKEALEGLIAAVTALGVGGPCILALRFIPDAVVAQLVARLGETGLRALAIAALAVVVGLMIVLGRWLSRLFKV